MFKLHTYKPTASLVVIDHLRRKSQSILARRRKPPGQEPDKWVRAQRWTMARSTSYSLLDSWKLFTDFEWGFLEGTIIFEPPGYEGEWESGHCALRMVGGRLCGPMAIGSDPSAAVVRTRGSSIWSRGVGASDDLGATEVCLRIREVIDRQWGILPMEIDVARALIFRWMSSPIAMADLIPYPEFITWVQQFVPPQEAATTINVNFVAELQEGFSIESLLTIDALEGKGSEFPCQPRPKTEIEAMKLSGYNPCNVDRGTAMTLRGWPDMTSTSRLWRFRHPLEMCETGDLKLYHHQSHVGSVVTGGMADWTPVVESVGHTCGSPDPIHSELTICCITNSPVPYSDMAIASGHNPRQIPTKYIKADAQHRSYLLDAGETITGTDFILLNVFGEITDSCGNKWPAGASWVEVGGLLLSDNAAHHIQGAKVGGASVWHYTVLRMCDEAKKDAGSLWTLGQYCHYLTFPVVGGYDIYGRPLEVSTNNRVPFCPYGPAKLVLEHTTPFPARPISATSIVEARDDEIVEVLRD